MTNMFIQWHCKSEGQADNGMNGETKMIYLHSSVSYTGDFIESFPPRCEASMSIINRCQKTVSKSNQL